MITEARELAGVPQERRNRIENLSVCEILDLALEGVRHFGCRLRQIECRVDAADRPLRELLSQTEADADRHEESVRQFMSRIGCSTRPRLNPAERRQLLRERFPSALRSFGEGFLERDAAIYFAELLHEDCSRFHGALAERSSEGPARAFLKSLADSCRCQVNHLRTVLL